jgi:signal transduction histidine kinase
MDFQDKQAALFAQVTGNLERVDHIIDTELQPAIVKTMPGALAKIEASMDIEASIAEMGLWTTAYREDPTTNHRRLIFAKDQEFRRALDRLKGLNLLPENRMRLGKVQASADRIRALMGDIVSLEDDLDQNTARFISLRLEMDNLLDDQIQILALNDLITPRIEANATTDRALRTASYLIPVFVLAVLAAGLLLIRLIQVPLKRLVDGTNEIGGGNLAYRIDLRGNDEFNDLARRFNHMVDRLQATTVSKGLLETSEEKLRATVADLLHEIAERERAEQERATLQTELRRSETLTAMGQLVAGVAHEVRNPLFGISSTLDAMQARFKDRGDTRRYVDVLRDEANRLSRLMADLLAYGKPAALELAPRRVREAIVPAIDISAPLAERVQIEVLAKIPTDIPDVRMDRMPLSQVFQNLIQNAIQHSPPGGKVYVAVDEIHDDTGHWVQCVVADGGAGLAEADLPRIFEPFFTRRQGGTGLGLAIARRIVEGHGGTITAGNRPEGGAKMTVRLPVAAAIPDQT